MSKRSKKSYDGMHEDYNGRISDVNNLNQGQYFNTYPNMYTNNIQDIFKNGVNFNTLFDILNNIDIKNLSNLMYLISDGFDINNVNLNNFNNIEDIYKNYNSGNIYNKNEIIINFFNSLKPILNVEVGNIIDKFIQFYMDEINKEK